MKDVKKSPWLIHYDGSSCNGCDIEVLACLTPVYDAERFGVVNTGDPYQADILVVTGGVNHQNAPVLKQIYEQMAEPKVVVAVGTCGCTGGIFKECYNILGGADTVIPVDIYVPGCAARPQSIIDGILQAVALFQKRVDGIDEEAIAAEVAHDQKKAEAKIAEDKARKEAGLDTSDKEFEETLVEGMNYARQKAKAALKADRAEAEREASAAEPEVFAAKTESGEEVKEEEKKDGEGTESKE